MEILHLGGPLHGQVVDTPGSLTYVCDSPAHLQDSERQYVLATLPGGLEVYHPVGVCYRQVKATYSRWRTTLDPVTSQKYPPLQEGYAAAPRVAAAPPADAVSEVFEASVNAGDDAVLDDVEMTERVEWFQNLPEAEDTSRREE